MGAFCVSADSKGVSGKILARSIARECPGVWERIRIGDSDNTRHSTILVTVCQARIDCRRDRVFTGREAKQGDSAVFDAGRGKPRPYRNRHLDREIPGSKIAATGTNEIRSCLL